MRELEYLECKKGAVFWRHCGDFLGGDAATFSAEELSFELLKLQTFSRKKDSWRTGFGSRMFDFFLEDLGGGVSPGGEEGFSWRG